jgi:antitoxin component HigA of HigAB toxin-antitoxin module
MAALPNPISCHYSIFRISHHASPAALRDVTLQRSPPRPGPAGSCVHEFRSTDRRDGYNRSPRAAEGRLRRDRGGRSLVAEIPEIGARCMSLPDLEQTRLISRSPTLVLILYPKWVHPIFRYADYRPADASTVRRVSRRAPGPASAQGGARCLVRRGAEGEMVEHRRCQTALRFCEHRRERPDRVQHTRQRISVGDRGRFSRKGLSGSNGWERIAIMTGSTSERATLSEVKPIRSEADYEKALTEVERLWGARSGTPEGDQLDVLATLIDAYESALHPIDPPDPIEAIKFRMGQHGATRPYAQRPGGHSRYAHPGCRGAQPPPRPVDQHDPSFARQAGYFGRSLNPAVGG